MIKYLLTGFILFGLLLPMSCSDEVQLPSGLSVQIENNSTTGEVAVHATAKNTSFFKIYFGEEPNEPVESTDGNAYHAYSATGSYMIVVMAYNDENKFISTHQTVEVVVPLQIPSEGYTTPQSYPGMTKVWSDEFGGTSLNTANWSYEIGTGINGWGNNELQYYKQENTTVQDGYLMITAKKEPEGNSAYTSSRLITKGKRAFKYGRVDIRAVLPKGQGIWPALWMLGTDIGTVGWPKCGEIDIMEM
ncbi:MAG TPA: glycoside hydrolase family 16 protein, partial [Chryseosolibacter sp.]|nr:glycoside hydrolase family 16 protein [Chryseosolibacter sp.]